MSIRGSCLFLPLPWWGDPKTIHGFQDAARYPLTEEGYWRDVVSQLIYGEDATAHHLCFGGEEGREDQTRTVTHQQVITQIQCLQRHKALSSMVYYRHMPYCGQLNTHE